MSSNLPTKPPSDSSPQSSNWRINWLVCRGSAEKESFAIPFEIRSAGVPGFEAVRLFYRIADGYLEVVRVLHVARQVDILLSDEA